MDNLPENAAEFTGPSFFVPDTVKAVYQHASFPTRSIKIRNFSRGGICIEDTLSVEVGTSLRFHLNIKGKKIDAQGEVTWNIKEGDNYVHGIKFTFIPHELSEWFNTFVMDWVAEHLEQNLDFSSLQTPLASERRSFARLKIPLKVEFGFNEDTMLLQAQIFDLSEGGVCLISNLELRDGQDLFLRIWASDEKFISFRGLVKYCKKKILENRYVNFHGVEFNSPDPKSVEELKQFLDTKRAQMDAVELSLDEIIDKTDFPELP